jgi:hypothetical protein
MTTTGEEKILSWLRQDTLTTVLERNLVLATQSDVYAAVNIEILMELPPGERMKLFRRGVIGFVATEQQFRRTHPDCSLLIISSITGKKLHWL